MLRPPHIAEDVRRKIVCNAMIWLQLAVGTVRRVFRSVMDQAGTVSVLLAS